MELSTKKLSNYSLKPDEKAINNIKEFKQISSQIKIEIIDSEKNNLSFNTFRPYKKTIFNIQELKNIDRKSKTENIKLQDLILILNQNCNLNKNKSKEKQKIISWNEYNEMLTIKQKN